MSEGESSSAASAPLKYHSERGHSRSASGNHVSHPSSAGATPAPSPSPPPTASCPHLSSVDLTLVRNRLRSRTFQKAYSADQLECVECAVHYPTSHLWVCLRCTKVDASRCGRYHQSHALHHFRDAGHALAMHLNTRVIWCYECDAEVPDEYDAPRGGDATAVTPRLIRSALDKEDLAPEVEEADAAQETESEADANEAFRALYTNEHGGQTGLSNLGNTCFFNSGIQALLHCPPLIAFFAAPPAHREAERHALAMLDCRTPQQQRNQEMRLQLLSDFGVLLTKVWSGRYHLCVPTDVLKDVLAVNPFFRGYGQHDAQELIRCVLDNFHEGNKLRVEYEYDLRRKLKQQAEEETRLAAEREKEEEAQSSAHAARLKRHASSNGAPMEEEDAAPAAKKATPPAKPRFPDCSVIGDLFQGTLESRVRCSACGAVSLTRDPFYDLSLEIPKDAQLKKIGVERGSEALTPQANRGFFGSISNYLGLTSPTLSLETCLHSFCTSDSLLQKDQYKCDKCKAKVDAVKILSLGDEKSLPEVLTLHVKRFTHNTFFGSKISRHVTFPIHNLDVAPYLTQPETNTNGKRGTKSHYKRSSNGAPPPSPALYDLFAVVRHLGSVNGGHYIAYCKSHVTNKWFEFDDKIVTEVSEDQVKKVEAYVLFYRRKYAPAPLQRILKQVDMAAIPNMPPMPTAAAASNGPIGPVRYVSKYWLKKMEIFGRPEPIDNRDLCCPHGMPKPLPHDGGDRAVAITPAGWESLFAEYGGGPIVDSHLGHRCEPCELPNQRKLERTRIAEADTIANRQSEDDPFFLIHSVWLNQWRQFVTQNGDRPGPITNHLLLAPVASGATPSTPLAGLQRGADYRALHGLVWDELFDLYGGGPVIQRPTSDIYVLEKPLAPPVIVEDEIDVDEPEDEDEEMQTEEATSNNHAHTNNNANAADTNSTARAGQEPPRNYAYVNNSAAAPHSQPQPQP